MVIEFYVILIVEVIIFVVMNCYIFFFESYVIIIIGIGWLLVWGFWVGKEKEEGRNEEWCGGWGWVGSEVFE